MQSNVPFIPENAPFSPEQRAWLNGFLAGLFSRQMPPSATKVPTSPPPKVTILFGSQTGNAEALARQVALRLRKTGYETSVCDMAEFSLAALAETRRLLVATSTYGDGAPPDNAKAFWNQLCEASAPRLERLEYAVLALGDTNYPKFCMFGQQLDARLEELGGRRIHSRIDCDVEYDEPFERWAGEVVAALDATKGECAPKLGNGHKNVAVLGPPTSQPEVPPLPVYSRKNPYIANIAVNRKLNGEGSAKDTRHIEIAIAGSGMKYEAGDAIVVRPQNDPALVTGILEAMGLRGDEAVSGAGEGAKPIRAALQEDYELTKIHKNLLVALAENSGDAELRGLMESKEPGVLNQFLWGKDVLDLLTAYPGLRLEPNDWTARFKKLLPRLYSISSSPKAHPDHVHITVGVLQYELGGRTRRGTCSAFLAYRTNDQTPIPVFIQPNKHFSVPKDDGAPLIMVGPGTGIAPFRAFLYERRERAARGKNWLFFGDQHERTDFLYRDEILEFKQHGILSRLDTAFSRDQEQKIYVQDRMLENANELYAWLEEGAVFCVCGDAKHMAGDVDRALRTIVREAGNVGSDAADEYVDRLVSEKRYLRDVY